MPEVNDLIQNFIDKNEIFPDNLFIDLAAEIFDDNDDPVKEFEDEWRRDIKASGRHYVDWRFF